MATATSVPGRYADPINPIKTAADWFNIGTAAVKFAKALAGFLAVLGIVGTSACRSSRAVEG
jgi:hypothetical protein